MKAGSGPPFLTRRPHRKHFIVLPGARAQASIGEFPNEKPPETGEFLILRIRVGCRSPNPAGDPIHQRHEQPRGKLLLCCCRGADFKAGSKAAHFGGRWEHAASDRV